MAIYKNKVYFKPSFDLKLNSKINKSDNLILLTNIYHYKFCVKEYYKYKKVIK